MTAPVLHLHLLDAVGSGGLETRIETIRRIDTGARYMIVAPATAEAAVAGFWGGEFAAIPHAFGADLPVFQAVTMTARLAAIAASASRVVLHSHTPWTAILAAVCAGPGMIHAHSLHGPAWLPWQGKCRQIYRHVLSATLDHLVVVSAEMEDRARALIAPRPVVRLDNGVALMPPPVNVPSANAPSVSASPRPQSSARTGVRLAAFASRLDPGKAEGVLDLFALLPDLPDLRRLDVYGDGTLRPALEAAAAPFAERIRFMGADMTFSDRIGQYDLVAGEGRVVLEALTAGVPALVCAARLSGIVTDAVLPRLLYANAALRGMGQTPAVTAADLLDLPASPILPAPSGAGAGVTDICRLLERPTPAARARAAFARRAAAVFRAYGPTYLRAFDALDYAGTAGDPWQDSGWPVGL